jgi:ketosteroid isomerase-like protein
LVRVTATENRDLVLSYIAASQRARASGLAEDFAAVRAFFADNVTVAIASAWTDDPYTIAFTDADSLIARLAQPVNSGARLETENRAVLADKNEVFVEQISTATTDDGTRRRSAVGFLFSVSDGRIASIKTFRNNLNVPT